QARRYAEAIIETVREPLLVIDASFRVERANRAFYDMFQTTAAATDGQSLFELGDGQWNVARMHRVLDQVLQTATGFSDIEVENVFPVSVGYDATIEAIASIAVPAIAEWCIVDVTEPDGMVTRAEVVYHEADPIGLSGPSARPTVIAANEPVANVLLTGQSLLLEDVPPSYLASGGWADEELA